MGKVAQANPGAKPEILAHAVNKFLPLMNQQAQMEWKQVQMAIMAERANQGADRIELQRGAEQRRQEQGDQRIDLQTQREARLAAGAQVRQDQGYQRLDMAKQELERKITQGGDRNALAQWRAVVDAQHKRAQEIIQSSNFGNTMDARGKKELLDEQRKFYDAEIEKMRAATGRTTPEGNKPLAGGGKVVGQAPAGKPIPFDVRQEYDAALSAGKPKDALIKRLQDEGYKTEGL